MRATTNTSDDSGLCIGIASGFALIFMGGLYGDAVFVGMGWLLLVITGAICALTYEPVYTDRTRRS
jgi:hypothetical protein